MKRTTAQELVVMVCLVASTVAIRVFFRDIPNFAPVAATALFAGYFFSSRWIALAVPVSVMMISDQFLGGYQPVLMVTVYGLLALPVLMRGWMRRSFDLSQRRAWTATVGLIGCSLTASVLFFLVTNLVTWCVTPWYSRDAAGLWQCYVSAIPFFRYTVAGDLTFASVLFGGYAFVHAMVADRSAISLVSFSRRSV